MKLHTGVALQTEQLKQNPSVKERKKEK